MTWDADSDAESSMDTRGHTDEIIRLRAWREAREGQREEGALVRQDEKPLRQKPFSSQEKTFVSTNETGSQNAPVRC